MRGGLGGAAGVTVASGTGKGGLIAVGQEWLSKDAA